MKKGIKVLALSLTLSMAFSTVAMAEDLPSGDQNVSGSGTLVSPTYDLVLPTASALDFELDPMNVKGDDQIAQKADAAIINKSNVAVYVNASVTLSTVGSGVNLKASKADVVLDDPTITDKDAYVEMIFAKAANADADGAKVTSPDYTDGDTIVLGEDAATFAAGLAAAKYSEGESPAFTSVADSDSAIAFKVSGAINPSAAWEAGDLAVSLVYNVCGLSAEGYTKVSAATYASEGLVAAQNTPIVLNVTLDKSGSTPVYTAEADLSLGTFATKPSKIVYTASAKDETLDDVDDPTTATTTSMNATYSAASPYEATVSATNLATVLKAVVGSTNATAEPGTYYIKVAGLNGSGATATLTSVQAIKVVVQ